LQGPNAPHRKICILFDLPLETIRHRCLKDRRLAVKEAERMWKAFQNCKPSARQLKRYGFDEVYSVRGDADGPLFTALVAVQSGSGSAARGSGSACINGSNEDR